MSGCARSLERTRLRIQAKITCYCGFLMHLEPSRPRSCRFLSMIQRLNSFTGDIWNTWKTRQKHDDNWPAAGLKQTDNTMATQQEPPNCVCRRKPWIPDQCQSMQAKRACTANHPPRKLCCPTPIYQPTLTDRCEPRLSTMVWPRTICVLLATSGSQDHAAGTSALPPTGDIR
jgi:hypothetical protein